MPKIEKRQIHVNSQEFFRDVLGSLPWKPSYCSASLIAEGIKWPTSPGSIENYKEICAQRDIVPFSYEKISMRRDKVKRERPSFCNDAGDEGSGRLHTIKFFGNFNLPMMKDFLEKGYELSKCTLWMTSYKPMTSRSFIRPDTQIRLSDDGLVFTLGLIRQMNKTKTIMDWYTSLDRKYAGNTENLRESPQRQFAFA